MTGPHEPWSVPASGAPEPAGYEPPPTANAPVPSGYGPPPMWGQPQAPADQTASPWAQPPHNQQPGTDGLAVAALVLGIIPVTLGLVGIILGVIARRRVKRTGQAGAGLALAGIVSGSAWFVLIVAGLVVGSVLSPAHDVHVTHLHAGSTNGVQAGDQTGTVSFRDLQVGNCVASPSVGSVTTISLLPCAGSHRGEVFSTLALSATSYPGESTSKNVILSHCRQDLPGFVKAAAGHTNYRINYIYPTASSWAGGDRLGICILEDPNHQALVGEAKGRGRHQ